MEIKKINEEEKEKLLDNSDAVSVTGGSSENKSSYILFAQDGLDDSGFVKLPKDKQSAAQAARRNGILDTRIMTEDYPAELKKK